MLSSPTTYHPPGPRRSSSYQSSTVNNGAEGMYPVKPYCEEIPVFSIRVVTVFYTQ